MYNLDGQVAIVTGAGSGLGRAISLRLSREGASIVAADVSGEAAEKIASEIKEQRKSAIAVQMDVSLEHDVERAVRQTFKEFGKIDILVNNAATGSMGLTVNQSEQGWDHTIRVNLKGTFLCSRAAAKEMIPRKRGRIVNISSISGKLGAEFIGPYCASKFGVIGLTQVMAKELGRFTITVNAVCPGHIWTPGWEVMAHWFQENFSALANLTTRQIFDKSVTAVLRRPQEPEDIAALVAFLASEEARNITGQAINVDGGSVMH